MKITRTLFLFGIVTLLISSCTKDDSKEAIIEATTLPTISTVSIDSITSYSAIAGGIVTNEGGSGVAARGICYGTTPLPSTTGNNITIAAGSGGGAFKVNLAGLTKGVQYYVRAYATNVTGTVYGDQVSFVPVFTIGQNYQGGILFYVDSTSNHGLIASNADLSGNAIWGCSGTSIAGARQTAYGTGAQNTTAIEGGCATTGIAARLCDSLVLGGYSDWFLPSYTELNLLYAQRDYIGGIANAQYWTSSEIDAVTAYSLFFRDGTMSGLSKAGIAHVRAIRAF